MAYISATLMAAVFRSIGINAQVTPPSDEKTLELGGLHSSGEECYPAKVTLGDFLRIIDADDFDASKHAFFMPTAEGPCRFGQYAPYLKQVLDKMGYSHVLVVAPTSKNSYEDVTEHGSFMMRRMWRGMIAGDILRKMQLKTRPYETVPGAADETMEQGLAMLMDVLERPGMSNADHMAEMISTLVEVRDMFRNIPARYTRDRPLIGVVGEIFCRLNTFSNYEAVRKIEAQGGEAWLSDMAEWVWYTNWSQRDRLRRIGRRFTMEMAGAHIKDAYQSREAHKLMAPFEEDFIGYEDPHRIYKGVLKAGWPYLPADGALGEMALSIGKSIYLHGMGADGIIDISPFSCMNGIISEAVYHAVSRDHDDMPIRNFYFDSTSSNMARDLDIFMELARSYQKRKTNHRTYPACFEG